MAGRTIGGRYQLQQPLGGGAMSSVWLAHDAELERDVAVKLLAHDADHARFEREAHAVASLAHPNICQLYDYGESGHAPYMVLEHLPGGTLEDLLAAKRHLPDEQTARIAHEIAAGLAHAHEHGLVHRDLKPSNVLFDGEGRAKIADFGIARIAGGDALTEAGTVLGTAAYLSPEQASGEPATPESDVYSFGVILFRMLTGRLPFASANAMELVRMHREQLPPRVEDVRADAPAPLAALAFAALAKDPAQRPADGSALLDALSGAVDPTLLLAPAAVAGDETATQVIRRPPRPRRRQRQRRFALLPAVIAAVALLAIVGAAAAYLITSSGGADSGSTTPSLDLPTVGRENTSGSSTTPIATPTTSTPATTAAPATSEQTPTQPSSTEQTSSEQATTQPATTQQLTTAVTTSTTATTQPATTSLPATTSATTPPATTAPLATTTAPPASTTAPATTTVTFTAP